LSFGKRKSPAKAGTANGSAHVEPPSGEVVRFADDAPHLANGVYLYKLESANQSVVTKMLLLK
jgi:hypothetical protein